jgi:enamine deaminase RidA (YjgF/YER057c/UK114 family)
MLYAQVTNRKNKAESTNSATLAEYEQQNQKVNWSGRSPHTRDRSDLATMQQAYGNQAALRMLEVQKGRSPSMNPTQGGVLQRKCSCGNGSGTGGTCTECQKKQGQSLQTKLRISEPGDRYEQEADRVAEQVMRMPEPTIKRQVESEKEEIIQRKAIAQQDTSEVPSIVQETLNSPGQPLNSETRTFMESRFGHDFNQVRVHTDAKAAESARTVNASAYTVHNNIVFSSGQYRPETEAGKKLLAHELTHTLQQQTVTTETTSLQKIGNDMYDGISDNISSEKKYDIEDAIARLGFALYFAKNSLDYPLLSPSKRDKIESQMLKLQPLITQLEEAKGTDGEGIIFGFDPDTQENEINSGDAEKSIDELYSDLSFSPEDQVIDVGDSNTQPEVLQAKTLAGGLKITPLTTPSLQRDGGATVVVIIILAGLLLEGCKGESSKATPATSSSKPTGKACVISETIPNIKVPTVVFDGEVFMQTEVEIKWEQSPNCNCACGEYRQYVKGHMIIGGKPYKLALCDGATLQEDVYQEDGDVQGNGCYGHRDRPGFQNDVFDQPNRSGGCHYLGKDQPRVPGPVGTMVDVDLKFKGQTYDKCANKFGQIHDWTFIYKGPLSSSFTP